MALIQFKRGTRAQIDAAAGANQLAVGEPYLITDEGRVAVGTGAATYQEVRLPADAIDPALLAGSSGDSRSLITAANYAAIRTLLGLVIGTNVQAYDAQLAALAGLSPANGKLIRWTGATTAALIDDLECHAIAVSDETTDLSAGTAKATFRMPWAFTVTAVRASVTTAPVGSTVIADINANGSSILGTKLSIDANEKTSTTAASAATITTASLANDAEITVDIDSVGSVTAGAGLKIYLIGRGT